MTRSINKSFLRAAQNIKSLNEKVTSFFPTTDTSLPLMRPNTRRILVGNNIQTIPSPSYRKIIQRVVYELPLKFPYSLYYFQNLTYLTFIISSFVDEDELSLSVLDFGVLSKLKYISISFLHSTKSAYIRLPSDLPSTIEQFHLNAVFCGVPNKFKLITSPSTLTHLSYDNSEQADLNRPSISDHITSSLQSFNNLTHLSMPSETFFFNELSENINSSKTQHITLIRRYEDYSSFIYALRMKQKQSKMDAFWEKFKDRVRHLFSFVYIRFYFEQHTSKEIDAIFEALCFLLCIGNCDSFGRQHPRNRERFNKDVLTSHIMFYKMIPAYIPIEIPLEVLAYYKPSYKLDRYEVCHATCVYIRLPSDGDLLDFSVENGERHAFYGEEFVDINFEKKEDFTSIPSSYFSVLSLEQDNEPVYGSFEISHPAQFAFCIDIPFNNQL